MFVNGDISMGNNVFLNLLQQSVSDSVLTVAHCTYFVPRVDGTSVVLFSDGSTLLCSELDSVIF